MGLFGHGLALTAAMAMAVAPAVWDMSARADPADWSLPPYTAFPGQAELDVSGMAGGAVFGASGAGGGQHASGVLKLMPRLHRDYDSGLSLGLVAQLAVDDPLSHGHYGGDFFEKAYGEIRTGLGRLEIGQTDGAGYALAVAGPKVDEQVSLDDPQTTFFRDPRTDRAFADIFALRTGVGASSNDAKFAYVSPALFGFQLALSFTPNDAREGLPFLHEGTHRPGRQADIWEGALRYSDDLGPISLSAYGGAAEGRAEHKLAGQEGVSDLGAGLRVDWPVDEDVTLSLGGAWRQSNAHAFDISQSWQSGTTRARSASAAASYGAWTLGAEYGDGVADAVAALPRLALTGYQAGLGYTLNDSVRVSAGWQRRNYDRSAGTFYNGAPRIGLNAVFLHLNLRTAP